MDMPETLKMQWIKIAETPPPDKEQVFFAGEKGLTPAAVGGDVRFATDAKGIIWHMVTGYWTDGSAWTDEGYAWIVSYDWAPTYWASTLEGSL